jgi:hypothetical protein
VQPLLHPFKTVDWILGRLLKRIRQAVVEDRFVVSWHADERCEERGVSVWQLAAGIEEAELVRERPSSHPNPSVVLRQILADGSDVEVIWSWLAESARAKLVTVYFDQWEVAMSERREKRKRWVRRGDYAVEVEIEVIYPADDPGEPCLEPATVRKLDEIAEKAAQGDVDYLQQFGRVYQAIKE